MQDEAFQTALFDQMCQGIHAISGQVHTLIIVSNELLNEPIGDNVFVIRYRLILGKLHQAIVEGAHQAFLHEAGIPILMKGEVR